MINSNPFTYKAHIDGLRALAVLPVVFFHAGFSWFKGGFVGVDIFFVISGFLITSIILKEKNNKRFSLPKFYLRRIRRIVPALFLVTVFTIPFSFFLMTDNDLKIFSQSVLSVIFFISNLFFWKQGGYFGIESELSPLLHTWSLGVEEQFYIFFPIFLILIWKIKKSFLIPSIIAISLISLASTQIGGNFKISNLTSIFPYFKLPFEWIWQAGISNFYSPFGRIWELMIGALISFYLQKKTIKENFINNFYSLFGLFLIIFSITTFSDNYKYPNFFALIPTVGTALIIIFTTKKTYLNKILSNDILVKIGLISFSFYLWHQPLLAFSRIYFVSNLSLIYTCFIIILSLILSYFSWKYIEQPFRDKNTITDTKLIGYFISFFLIILISSNLLLLKKNYYSKITLPYKLEESFKAFKEKDCFDIKFAHQEDKDKWFCKIGAQNTNLSFAVVGDSHALSLKKVFDKAAKEKKISGLFTGFSGCIPLLDIYTIRPDQVEKNCKKLNSKLFEYIKDKNIKKIFLVARWTYYTDGNYEKTEFSHISKINNYSSNKKNSRKAFEYGLSNTIKKYDQIGVNVIFLHQVPLQNFAPHYIYLHSIKKNKINYEKLIYNLSVDYEKHTLLQKFVREKVNSINTNLIFNQIDPGLIFCDKVKCIVGTKDSSFYSDDDHLSVSGSMKLNDEIKSHLD